MIPYARQHIDQADIDSVVSILRSEYLTQGPAVPKFEDLIAKKVGGKYGIATNSATSALHIACLSLGLGVGDRLWTSPNTFVATANCALYCGALVDFIDIDSSTYNMDFSLLEKKLIDAEKTNTLPKIVIPVHFAGQSCDMRRLKKLSLTFGFKIIEDASHAVGGKYYGDYIGNCKYSDITVFSFHPVKIITTGEGGMAITNDTNLADKMRLFRSHGITGNKSQMVSKSDNEIWNYQQIALGFNYRMTDISAALGISQFGRLDEFVDRRHRIANYYNKELADLPIILPHQNPEASSSYHLYPIKLDVQKTNIMQKDLYDECYRKGLGVNLHYIPVYLQPYYQEIGFKSGYCPCSEDYFNHSISIPIFPAMTDDDCQKVVTTLRSILN